MRTVRKDWMRWERGAKPQRVLANERGFVFGVGRGGWMIPPERSVLNLLPGAYNWHGWPHEGWWGRNWRRPEWAWIYGK